MGVDSTAPKNALASFVDLIARIRVTAFCDYSSILVLGLSGAVDVKASLLAITIIAQEELH